MPLRKILASALLAFTLNSAAASNVYTVDTQISFTGSARDTIQTLRAIAVDMAKQQAAEQAVTYYEDKQVTEGEETERKKITEVTSAAVRLIKPSFAFEQLPSGRHKVTLVSQAEVDNTPLYKLVESTLDERQQTLISQLSEENARLRHKINTLEPLGYHEVRKETLDQLLENTRVIEEILPIEAVMIEADKAKVYANDLIGQFTHMVHNVRDNVRVYFSNPAVYQTDENEYSISLKMRYGINKKVIEQAMMVLQESRIAFFHHDLYPYYYSNMGSTGRKEIDHKIGMDRGLFFRNRGVDPKNIYPYKKLLQMPVYLNLVVHDQTLRFLIAGGTTTANRLESLSPICQGEPSTAPSAHYCISDFGGIFIEDFGRSDLVPMAENNVTFKEKLTFNNLTKAELAKYTRVTYYLSIGDSGPNPLETFSARFDFE